MGNRLDFVPLIANYEWYLKGSAPFMRFLVFYERLIRGLYQMGGESSEKAL